jgi:alanine racemase
MRAAWAEVDLGAIAHNVRQLLAVAAPAAVCAVVKADGYGHGVVPVATATLQAGAQWLAVALPEEGAALRDAGIDAPVLVLSEPPPSEMELVARTGLRPTLYTRAGIHAAAVAAKTTAHGLPVHLKVDTGMHRVGADPGEAVELAELIGSHPELELEAVWTHCAVADEPDNPFTAEQLRRFDGVVDALGRAGLRPPLLHAANSAAAIAHPAARYDFVRAGIALYGIAPSPALAGVADLRPAMSLKARVAMVKDVAAGEGISYGHQHVFDRPAVVATVPIGYADGVRRRLSAAGGQVLIRGRRHPIVGVVTMDQLMVDCGDEPVEVGDEVVLIGEQGGETVTAEEWAARLDTVGYEIVCGIGPRVPRRYRSPQ